MSFLQPQHPVIQLGVNIHHVATLRNARGTVYPDPVQAALLADGPRDARARRLRARLRRRRGLRARRVARA